MKKRNLNIISIAGIIVALTFGGFAATNIYAHHEEKVAKEEKIEKQKKLALEKKHEEEDKQKQFSLGINLDAKKYTYDATAIWDRFKNHNFHNNGKKIAFLTFDDGTSTTVTPQILKTLDKYNVKATFFIVGSGIERGGQKAKDLLKEEFAKGHAIGTHTYSHDYKLLYPGRVLNFENFKADLDKNEQYLKNILGPKFSTKVVRAPGGEMSWKNMAPLNDYLSSKHMAAIDWNAASLDAVGHKKVASQLVEGAKQTSNGKDIVVMLMHDTYGKEETAKALPQIIENLKAQGYEFKTLG